MKISMKVFVVLAALFLVSGFFVGNGVFAIASPPPSNNPTTNAANPFDAISATLNGTVGASNAQDTGFWWGTTSAGPFISGTVPSVGAQLPPGWTTSEAFSGTNAGLPFSHNLTGLTPNTTYYFAAWNEVSGIWYPGTVEHFTTPSANPITQAQTNVTTTDATLNGTNSPTNATNHTFWVSTSPFVAALPVPAGISSTPLLGPISANANWSVLLSSLTTNGVPGNLPAITPNTTYYYAAWTQIGGTWYPGSVVSFNTAALDTTPPTTPVHVSPANNSVLTTTNLTQIDWTDSTDADSPPVTYIYQAANDPATNPDGSFVSPVYTSGPLTDSSIPTTGTPEGVYYWHVKAVDSAPVPNSSPWTSAWKITVDNTAPVVTVTPVAGSTLSGTVQFNITVTDANLDPSTLSNIFVYLYNSTGAQKSQGASVDLSSGTGIFTVDTTQIDNGNSWLDVGQLFDAAGNASGPTDTYFKDYDVENIATLTINKVLVPSEDSGKFNLQIDETTAGTGANVGNNGTTGAIQTTVGAHTVGEIAGTGTTLSDYDAVISGDCAANGSITLLPNDNKVCTITNTKKGHLIVQKTTIPAADATEFAVTISGSGAITGDASGIVTDATDKDYQVAPGTYSVIEDSLENWDQTSNTCKDVVVTAGQTSTCLITNTKKGTIIIKKVADGGNGTFSFTTTGDDLSNFTINTSEDSTKTFSDVSVGSYSVTEGTLPYGWDFTSLTCDSEAGVVNAETATITLGAGKTITCTYTNTKRGSITVYKDVVGPNNEDVSDSQQFTIHKDTDDGRTISENSKVKYTDLVPGTYTITEDQNNNYGDISYSVDGDTGTAGAQITVAPGQKVKLTITNKQKLATLTIVKHVTNHDIGTKVASDFSFEVNGGPTTIFSPSPVDNLTSLDGQNVVQINPGTFNVTEDAVDGYAPTLVGCSGTITSGGETTCTITNSDIPVGKGSITIIKQVNNITHGGDLTAGNFTLKLTANGETPIITTVTSGQANFVAPGNYTVSENDPSEQHYTQTSLSCVGGAETSSGTFDLVAQEAYVCTIVNTSVAPSLTLVKSVANTEFNGSAVATDWTVSADGPTPISGAGTVSSDSGTFKAGPYTLSEATTVPESELSNSYTEGTWSCTNDVAVNADNEITLTIGQTTTCTITNTAKPATLKIIKTSDSGDGSFQFQVKGTTSGTSETQTIPLSTDGGTATSSTITLNKGEYDVNEINLPEGWHLASAKCVYGETAIGNTIDGGDHITVDNGDSVTCTFANTKKAVLSIKKVVVNDGGGTKTAADFSFQVHHGEETAVPSIAFEADGQNDITTTAGVYTITEVAAPGYTTTYNNCSAVSLPAGGTATCTITNTAIQPKLTVTKVVVGGTKQVSDFPLFVGDTSVTSGTQTGFNAGHYTVHETSNSNYTSAFSGDCNADGITLAIGDVKTCTITNTFVNPTTTETTSSSSGGGGGGGGGGGNGGAGNGTITYTITASAGANGSMNPTGLISVSANGGQTFMIFANAGFVPNVLVDGISVGSVSTYVFNNVNANHTIVANFLGTGEVAGASTGPSDNGGGNPPPTGGTGNPVVTNPTTGTSGDNAGSNGGTVGGASTQDTGGSPTVTTPDTTTQPAAVSNSAGFSTFWNWIVSNWPWLLLLLIILILLYWWWRQQQTQTPTQQ